MHDAARAFAFRPEIVTVHRPVCEPERAMMRMIGFFSGHFHHWIIARHRQPTGPDDRITERARHVRVEEFGEELAVEFDAHMVVGLRDADSQRIGRH